MKSSDAPPLDRWLPYAIYQSEIIRLLETVSLVGGKMCLSEPQIEVTAADLAEAQKYIGRITRPLVVIHPGAADFRRRWPTRHFATVADQIARDRGVQVVLTGTEAERDIVDRVMDAMHAPAINLCGCLTIGGLTGLLSQAQLVISNDTGPLHLARAVNTPTVGVFWAPNVINWGPLFRERHRVVLSWTVECPVCGWTCPQDYPFNRHNGCDHAASFVEAADPQEVLDSALDLLPARGGAYAMSG